MIGNDWDEVLKNVWQSPGFKNFYKIILNEYKNKIIYPPQQDIFNALKITPYQDVKVVIVGQDPYHGEGQAHGLAFSVNDGVEIPRSLKNIFKELHDDLGIEIPRSGNLTKWAQNGVLLLNDVLTVVENTPHSHQAIGWQLLTDYIIRKINEKKEPVVFILWGNDARQKASLINGNFHKIITSSHPSPYSANRGFLGSKPFSQANNFLIRKKRQPVDWRL